MSPEAGDLLAWIERDPSPTRVGLAVAHYNWDGGMDFLYRVVENHEIDRAAILELAVDGDAGWACEYGTREEAAAEDEFVVQNYDLFTRIETGWRAGKFRTQDWGPMSGGRRQVSANGRVEGFEGAHPTFTFLDGLRDMKTDLLALTPDALDAEDAQNLRAALAGVGTILP